MLYCNVWFAECVMLKVKSALFFAFFSLLPLILPYKIGAQKNLRSPEGLRR